MTETIQALRETHRRRRAALCEETLSANASALSERIQALDNYRDAENVAAYIAIRGEIDVRDVVTTGCDHCKNFFLPILAGDDMFFAQWHPGQPLVKKGFGLLEPDVPPGQYIDVQQLDVVLVPLVVFDDRCNRVGQGGGFYDRTFAHKLDKPDARPLLIGVAHDSQREPRLIPQSWDVPLNMIVTDSAVYSR